MSIPPENGAVLAIDGGGTRCRLALAQGDTIVTVETGAANISTDLAAAVAEILHGLDLLAERTGCPVVDLLNLPAYLGLAGAIGPQVTARLEAALPFARARIEDDRAPALRGALGAADGFLAHCGTGSFLGRQQAGEMRFAGGWGPVLGDEASSVWLGRRAMARALDAVDGHCPQTPLLSHILTEHGGAAGVVAFAARATATETGALARVVTGFAEREDAAACALLARGAEEIAERLRGLGWRPGDLLCLAGGLGPAYAPYLPDAMRETLTPPQAAPLIGAVALARKFADETRARQTGR